MKAGLPANLVVVLVVLGWLASAAARDPKPIEILHMPHVAIGPADIGFHVRIHADHDDRQVSILLCDIDLPCTFEQHERLSQRDIEGELAPPLWTPAPWVHVDAGEYLVVAAIGPRGRVRARAQERLSVRGPD